MQTLELLDIHPRKFEAGQDIFKEGDAGDGMYFVDTGEVEIWVERSDGRHQLAVVESGNIFGEMALIDGKERTASASALTDVVLLFVPEPTFRLKMAGTDPFIVNLLQLLFRNVRSVAQAADQRRLEAVDRNPLTRLPGNRSIEAQIEQCLADVQTELSMVYFDFDYFKPFNDGFGFQKGDEAIALFADAMCELETRPGCFVGHVGGDDFFAVFRESGDTAEGATRWLLERFRHDVRKFYDKETRAKGSYEAKDRDGNLRSFPLLRVSAVQLEMKAGRGVHTGALMNTLLAQGKKSSKASTDGFYRRSTEHWG